MTKDEAVSLATEAVNRKLVSVRVKLKGAYRSEGLSITRGRVGWVVRFDYVVPDDVVMDPSGFTVEVYEESKKVYFPEGL